MLFVLKTPLASVGRSCCGLSICPVLTFKKPQQRRPELLTSLANVINHVLGTWVLLDKSHNICHAFCNFLLILHTLFSLSSPLAGEIYVWTRSDARELVMCHSSTGQYALWEIGVAINSGLAGVPGANTQWPLKRFTRNPPWFRGHCTWETTLVYTHEQLAHSRHLWKKIVLFRKLITCFLLRPKSIQEHHVSQSPALRSS